MRGTHILPIIVTTTLSTDTCFHCIWFPSASPDTVSDTKINYFLILTLQNGASSFYWVSKCRALVNKLYQTAHCWHTWKDIEPCVCNTHAIKAYLEIQRLIRMFTFWWLIMQYDNATFIYFTSYSLIYDNNPTVDILSQLYHKINQSS
jgi:hypothetical protein